MSLNEDLDLFKTKFRHHTIDRNDIISDLTSVPFRCIQDTVPPRKSAMSCRTRNRSMPTIHVPITMFIAKSDSTPVAGEIVQ